MLGAGRRQRRQALAEQMQVIHCIMNSLCRPFLCIAHKSAFRMLGATPGSTSLWPHRSVTSWEMFEPSTPQIGIIDLKPHLVAACASAGQDTRQAARVGAETDEVRQLRGLLASTRAEDRAAIAALQACAHTCRVARHVLLPSPV